MITEKLTREDILEHQASILWLPIPINPETQTAEDLSDDDLEQMLKRFDKTFGEN